MLRRAAAAIVGALFIILGVLGQPSAAERVAYALYAAGASLGALGAWWSYRQKQEPLTWKPLAGWSAVGGAIPGLVIGGFINGLGAGVFIGLVYGGINGTFRKTRSETTS